MDSRLQWWQDPGSVVNRQTALRIAVIAVVVAVLAVAYRTGVLAKFSSRQMAQQTLLGLGGLGYLAFVGAYTVLQPFGIPGSIFVFVAPLIWPFEIAFALSMVGTMSASVVGFSFSRFVARDWLAPKIPARFARYNDDLERRAFVTVVLLRMVFWMSQPLHAFLGLSKVPFWTHFWGSFVGYLPVLAATSYFGPALIEWMKAHPLLGFLILLTLFLLILAWHYRKLTRPSVR
ncbi:MAG: TVP38/TMEM64 family protein [Myxococcales bacterium]|nr:TVP38/TMEM64 family protein [Myxococcales bacterium]